MRNRETKLEDPSQSQITRFHRERNATMVEKAATGRETAISASQRKRLEAVQHPEDKRNLPFWPRSYIVYHIGVG